jgi:hypothetical protein
VFKNVTSFCGAEITVIMQCIGCDYMKLILFVTVRIESVKPTIRVALSKYSVTTT